MVKLERIYGDRADLFRAILARISRPNKLPISSWRTERAPQHSCFDLLPGWRDPLCSCE
jgi:hypothetical protein